jgi:hypothetical protein
METYREINQKARFAALLQVHGLLPMATSKAALSDEIQVLSTGLPMCGAGSTLELRWRLSHPFLSDRTKASGQGEPCPDEMRKGKSG